MWCYDAFTFGIRHLADHRARVGAEDFAHLADRRQARDVPSRLNDATILMMHPRTPGQLHDRLASARDRRTSAPGLPAPRDHAAVCDLLSRRPWILAYRSARIFSSVSSS